MQYPQQKQGLHHRRLLTTTITDTNNHTSELDQIPSNDDKNKKFKLTSRSETPVRPINSIIKTSLKRLFFSYAILSLLIYSISLVFKDWPPDGQRLNPDGSIDQFQGEWWVSPNLTRANRIMLVVAHPDDECLFFSPTLLNLISPRFVNQTEFNSSIPNVDSASLPDVTLSSGAENYSTHLESPQAHILSLSSGNADGLGIKRAREMRASCWAFGIPSPQCIVLDDPDLPDSMSVWWPEKKIAEFVKIYIDLWKIDLIITFDHHGVSGHANHRAIAAALSRLVHTDSKFPMTFMLRSHSIIAKYSSLLSLPFSLYEHDRNRKLFLPQFPRPMSHPSRDRRRVADLVLRTLIHFNATTYTNVTSSLLTPNLDHNHTLPQSSVDGVNPLVTQEMKLNNLSSINQPNNRTRITDSRLSSHHSLFLSTPRQYYEGRRAFTQHVSQNAWFRRLWLIFSRYMWINELIRIVPLEDRFEDAKQFSQPSEAEKIIFPVLPKPSPLTSLGHHTTPPPASPLDSSPTNHHLLTDPGKQ